jgi:hypothetical protein
MIAQSLLLGLTQGKLAGSLINTTMKVSEEIGPAQNTLEFSSNIELVQDSVLAFSVNYVTGELLTASTDKIRVYSLLTNSLLADYTIPQFSLQQDQRRMLYRVKQVVPLIFSSGWLVVTSLKKQVIYFSKYLMVSKPIDVDDHPELVVVNQTRRSIVEPDQDFYTLGPEKRTLRSYYLTFNQEYENVLFDDQDHSLQFDN